MNILAIDSSAKVTSVSVINEQRILAEFNTDTRLTHSQTLMPMVNALLECSNLQISNIDGFAVSVGPGSFTGLRIGIGAIKGLAFALDKPCVGVSTLHALAYNIKLVNGVVCACMDARCNQVYTAIFKAENGKLTRLIEDTAISIDELLGQLSRQKEKIFFVGDGADLCYNKANENKSSLGIGEFFLADANLIYQKATSVGFISLDSFNTGETVSANDLKPSYLRLPQAQRELLKKQNKKGD